MNNYVKNKEECQVVFKNADFKSTQADKELIMLKKERSDDMSSENQPKCFVIGYN